MSAALTEVVALSQEREKAYQAFIGEHPDALFYYGLPYRDFLVELLGCEPRYAVAVRSAGVVGVLPMMAMPGSRGVVLNALPYFGSNGSILAADHEAHAALDSWYAQRAVEPDVAASTMVENPLAPVRVPPPHDLEDSRIGTVTRLVGDAAGVDLVFDLIDGSARRNIKKAARAGVKVEVDNSAFEDLARLHEEGMTAIGGRVKSPRFFTCVDRCLDAGTDYDVFVGRLDGAVVAALLVFYFGTTVEYYMPASSAEHRNDQPMAAVLHTAMGDAKDRGFTRWNWGGSWVTQENLLRFKSKWGGEPHPYRYWTKVNNQEVLSATAAELLSEYPDFFVVPFSALDPPS